jgi:hypothetical protein
MRFPFAAPTPSQFEKYQQRRWGGMWRRKMSSGTYCFAMANTDLAPTRVPDEVFGHFVSIVPTKGKRVYAFESRAGRDLFLTHFEKFGAVICENPWP